jgi:hypothetical protein
VLPNRKGKAQTFPPGCSPRAFDTSEAVSAHPDEAGSETLILRRDLVHRSLRNGGAWRSQRFCIRNDRL